MIAIITLRVIMYCMIINFADKETEKFFVAGKSGKLPPDLIRIALRKLDYLNRAKTLKDLCSPPGNCLESLRGNLKGSHSIRINDQFRIIFKFRNGDAFDVEIRDYH